MRLCEYCSAAAVSTVTSRYARPCIPLSVRVCWPHERDLFDQGDGVSRRSVPLHPSKGAAMPSPILPPSPIRSSVITLIASLKSNEIPRPYVKPVIVSEKL